MVMEAQPHRIKEYKVKDHIREEWSKRPGSQYYDEEGKIHTQRPYIPSKVQALFYTGSLDSKKALRKFIGLKFVDTTLIGQPVIAFNTGEIILKLGHWVIKNVDDGEIFLWNNENFIESFEEIE